MGIAFGIMIFAGGLGLMWFQWQVWQKDQEKAKSDEDHTFFYKKFRRRTLIGSMVAIIGAMLTSWFYAEDPIVRTTMIAGALLILLALLMFAMVDAISVYVYYNHSQQAGLAQKKLAEEYKQMREKAAAKLAKEVENNRELK